MTDSMLSAQRAAVALAVLAGCHGAQAATWAVWAGGEYEPARQVILTPWGAQMFTIPAKEGLPEQARIIPVIGMGWDSSLGSPLGFMRSTGWGVARDGALALSEQLADGSVQFVARGRKSAPFKTIFSTLLQLPMLNL